MAPASNEEQFKFLISCIRYSNNGKVDFGQVAAECKIVSKGAAAKRYERMMRAHGIASNAAAVKPAATRVSKAERHESSSANNNKKRKTDHFIEENTATDDDETFNVKQDLIDKKEILRVKEEESGQLSMDEAANLMKYYNNSSHACASPLGAEQSYNFGGASSGAGGYGSASMATSSSGWGMGSVAAMYDYSTPYNSGSIHVPRSTLAPSVASSYYTAFQYPTTVDNQGGVETPVIVE